MRSSQILALGLGALGLLAASCGSSDDSSSGTTAAASVTTAAAATTPGSASGSGEAVKVAFITKFPVAFFTAMEDAAKAYAAENPGVDISYFSCKTPSDVACQTAQIEDAVAKGFQAIVITPMGTEVIPAMDAAADKGVKVVLADNNLDDFKKKTAVAATDNVKGGQAAGAYLKSVLKSGDSIGLMEGVRGVPALDARIQGVKDALEGTGVNVIIGGAETKCDSAQGATVAEDLLTREPQPDRHLLGVRRPGHRCCQGCQGQGQDGARDGLRRSAGCGEGDHGRRHEGDDRPVPRQDGGSRRRGRRQRRPRRDSRTVHRHRHRAGHERQRLSVPPVPVGPSGGRCAGPP